MADTIQIKRRAADNAAPTILADGELALNAFDMTLYAKNKDGVIKKLNDSYTRAEVDSLLVGATPSGTIIYVAMNTAPTGYLKANGAAVSRTTYAALFAAIGTTFGVGDGSTTFNVPELRGEFIRGWDDGRAVDTGRVFGSAQGEAIQSHNHSASSNSTGSHAHTHLVYHDYGFGVGAPNRTTGMFNGGGGAANLGGNAAGEHSHTITVTNTGGPETRPRNVALLACIKF